ncbi:uncharacterized protein LOC122078105 [Macadamia integrifolia]|uniref:uncharacterized protein LOC122078105 n=1 Tax=Macadamia integrifolia TaxID=60698 RepID=UPI001C4ED653|nr:uncharacterized protein LOC122078105 [Macadamia integrifolia]
MRARRLGDVRTRSPPPKIRDHRSEWRPDPCPSHRRDMREDHHPRSLRSLSPLEVERSRRVLVHDRRSTSVERRDYTRHLNGGRDCMVVRSPSPLYGQSRNRSQFNENSSSDGFRLKYLLPDPVYSNADPKPSLKYVDDCSSGFSSSRIGKQKNFNTIGSSALEENGMLFSKSLYMEDRSYRKFVTLPPEVAAVINSGKVGGDIGHGRVEDLRYGDNLGGDVGHGRVGDLRYGDNRRPDIIASRELYEEEKPVFYSRDAPYSTMPLSHSNAFGSTSSGQGPSKDDFLGFYGGGRTLPSDGFARSGGKLTDPVNRDDYRQQPYSSGKDFELPQPPPFGSGKDFELRQDLPFGSGKHTELRQKDLESSQLGLLSPAGREAREYNYPELGRRERVDPEYLSDNLYRNLHPTDGMVHDHSNSVRPCLMDNVVNRVESASGSHRTLTESALWDYTLQGEPASNYYDVDKISRETKQDGESLGYRNTHLEIRSRMLRDHDNDISQSVIDYGYERDAGPVSYGGRLQSSTMSECGSDIYRLDLSPERRLKAEELRFYDPSVRVTNRNHTIDEEMNRYNHRYISSNDDDTISQVQESIDGDEQWTGEHSTSLLWSKRLHYRRPQHGKKTERVFDRMAHHRGSASDDWMPPQDLSLRVRGCPREPRIACSRNVSVKKRLRLGPSNFHNSYTLDRKHTVYRPCKFQKRNQYDLHGDVNDQNAGPSEDQGSPAKPEPPEGSEKFNQKAYEAFLRFSKQLNENPAHQRRYKEQGNAGSLLCIVCGSQSKEFGDTRSLVTHALMSQKQSRADHWGLHKAICVLMGWNSTVPRDGIWVHADLPHAEALALKEDLILWPPLVIIHNSSIGNKDPDRRKVLTIEDMEAILKEMGFGGGRPKVCHGRPANQSVMVVKFAPTFSGLQDAERLHNYYTKNKRGRVEFQQINAISRNGNGDAGIVEGDEMEQVLYGYLGIAEDLSKVDFETKKRAMVKSKKDILAIADAPLKAE